MWNCELIAYIAVKSAESTLIDYALRSGGMKELDDYQVYNTIQDIWPDCPISDEDYLLQSGRI
ncbi:MAG TPA: hypothetical protein VF849_01185 [Blattabacteriaceae bacterium]